MLVIITDSMLEPGSILLDRYSNPNAFSFCAAYLVVEDVSSNRIPNKIRKLFDECKEKVYMYSLEELIDVSIDNFKDVLRFKYSCDFNCMTTIKIYKSESETLKYTLFIPNKTSNIKSKLITKNSNKYLKIKQ